MAQLENNDIKWFKKQILSFDDIVDSDNKNDTFYKADEVVELLEKIQEDVSQIYGLLDDLDIHNIDDITKAHQELEHLESALSEIY